MNHTPGALRASKKIVSGAGLHHSLTELVASIIDRETGARELYEALKSLHAHTKNDHCICGLNTKAEQAIAKYEARP